MPLTSISWTPAAGGTYINSGSWTPNYDLDNSRNKGLTINQLAQRGLEKSTLDFVRVDFPDSGPVRGTLQSFGSLRP